MSSNNPLNRMDSSSSCHSGSSATGEQPLQTALSEQSCGSGDVDGVVATAPSQSSILTGDDSTKSTELAASQTPTRPVPQNPFDQVASPLQPALSEKSCGSGEVDGAIATAPSQSSIPAGDDSTKTTELPAAQTPSRPVPQNPFDQVATPQSQARAIASMPTAESVMRSSTTEITPKRNASAAVSVGEPTLLTNVSTHSVSTNDTNITPQKQTTAPSIPLPNAVTPMDNSKSQPVAVQPRSAAPASEIIYGLEHLERQQEALELFRSRSQRSQSQPQQETNAVSLTIDNSTSSLSHQSDMLHRSAFDDDEDTEPSSAVNSAEQAAFAAGNKQQNSNNVGRSFARFVEHTRKRLSTSVIGNRTRKDSDDENECLSVCLVSGYLQKLGRNGKWQTRWFETDGECLSYYKSSKRTKLLATLDLEKVGAIGIERDDTNGCAFTIEVLGRNYHLRADSRASCRDWVIMLNRVKEARMQQGNVKLVKPPRDLLDQSEGEDVGVVTPRVVVVANRQRTRAVAESVDWKNLLPGNPENPALEPSSQYIDEASAYDISKRRSTIGTAVLSRWTKRRSSLSLLGVKLARWARSIRKYGCANADGDGVVVLDRYVHPPGHDDKAKNNATARPTREATKEAVSRQKAGPSDWIVKETTLSGSCSVGSEEGRPPMVTVPSAPETRARSVSDIEARVIA